MQPIMRRTGVWLCFAVALLGLAVALRGVVRHGAAAEAPAPAHVDDPLRMLGPFGVVVERQCRAMDADLGIDVRVATRRAGDEDVAALAERLFRELGVARDAPTGGILIVLDGENGRARIEVSYSLEGVLPDAFSSRVARDQLVPYASHRAVGMAVMDVLHFLRNRVLDAVASGGLQLPTALRAPDQLERLLTGHSGGAGAQVALPELPSHAEFKRRVPDERRARYAPSADPMESVAALARTHRDLVGDPTLELFTAGSRVMRERYPVAPYEELLRAEAMERAAPLELSVRGALAFVSSRKAVRDFVPILLVREGGLWRVDLVETFKVFRFDGEGMFRLDNRASPYAIFLPDVAARYDDSLAPVDLHGEPLDAAIARLERSTLARDRFELAEILMRNCFVSAEAMSLYEAAALADPPEPKYAVRFAQRAVDMGMPEAAIEAVKRLGPAYAAHLGWLYEHAGERALAREQYRAALARNPRDRFAGAALERLERGPG